MPNPDTVVIGPFRVKKELKRELDRIIRERSKNPETEITLNRIGEIALTRFVKDEKSND
jgi:hypothetical protein